MKSNLETGDERDLEAAELDGLSLLPLPPNNELKKINTSQVYKNTTVATFTLLSVFISHLTAQCLSAKAWPGNKQMQRWDTPEFINKNTASVAAITEVSFAFILLACLYCGGGIANKKRYFFISLLFYSPSFIGYFASASIVWEPNELNAELKGILAIRAVIAVPIFNLITLVVTSFARICVININYAARDKRKEYRRKIDSLSQRLYAVVKQACHQKCSEDLNNLTVKLTAASHNFPGKDASADQIDRFREDLLSVIEGYDGDDVEEVKGILRGQQQPGDLNALFHSVQSHAMEYNECVKIQHACLKESQIKQELIRQVV